MVNIAPIRYVWDNNVPIAIHVLNGGMTQATAQAIANREQLPVRDWRPLPKGEHFNDCYPK